SAAVDAAIEKRLTLRDSARAMLPAEYSFEGKSSEQIKLDAIAACRPELTKSFGEKPDASVVDGPNRAHVADKTVYVKREVKQTDGSGADTRTERQKYLDSLVEANRKALEAK